MCPYSFTIKNPRYRSYSIGELSLLADYWRGLDGIYDPLAEFQSIITVPCGKCYYCLKRKRSDLYVRCMSEFIEAMRLNGPANPPVFLTLTIRDSVFKKYFEDEERNPAVLVRAIRERCRKAGYKFRMFLLPELSPEKKRLHFHGLLFNPCDYRSLHRCFNTFGWSWIRPATPSRIGYILKYITKDADKGFRPYLPIHFGDNLAVLGVYDDTAKCVSFSGANGRTYRYPIPRRFRQVVVSTKTKIQQLLSTCFSNIDSFPEAERNSLAVRLQLAADYFGVALTSDSVLREAPPHLLLAMRKAVETGILKFESNSFKSRAELVRFSRLSN